MPVGGKMQGLRGVAYAILCILPLYLLFTESPPPTVVFPDRKYFFATFTPTAEPTPTASPTPTPTPTPTPIYQNKKDWPACVAPHLQEGEVKEQWCAAKIFSCSQVEKISPNPTRRPFILARMYGDHEGMELDEVGPQEMATRWIRRFEDTFSGCVEKIDAAEVFNEVSGDGEIGRQKNVAAASLIISRYLVGRGIRPVVFNYPVGAPTLQDARVPEARKLIEYISKNGGAVGVHLYFDCTGYVPETWNFAQVHKMAGYPPITYIATEAGVCRRYPWGWDPYEGWRSCRGLTVEQYAAMLSKLFSEAKARGVTLGGVFVFTISSPYQGWESFGAAELFR